MKTITTDVVDGISQIKEKGKTGTLEKDTRSAYQVASTLVCGDSAKKRKISKVSKRVNVRWGFLKKKGSQRKESKFTPRKRSIRKDCINEESKKCIREFWENSVSRPTGNRKDLVQKRISAKLFDTHVRHVLEMTQTEAYHLFKSTHSNIKVSQRSFEKLKPFFVFPARGRDRVGCLCRLSC